MIYKPYSAGVLLIAFLIVTLLVGALLVASFLAVALEIYPQLPSVRRITEAQRSVRKPEFGVFIPTVAIEILIGGVWLLIRPFYGHGKIIWLEKTRQVLWYIVYSPIILLVGIVELLGFAGEKACKCYERYRNRI